MTIPSVSAEEATQETFLVAWNGPFTMTCGPGGHPVLPTEDPDPSDPAWLASGEPECAPGDALNAAREAQGEERTWHGLGVARHVYTPDQEGTFAVASFEEPLFGPGTGFLRVMTDPLITTGERVVSEGCGPQSILLPIEPIPHIYPPPTKHWWAYAYSVGIQDDLTTCFATAGVLHASWGSS